MNSYYKVENFGDYYRISSLENVYSYVIEGIEKAMLIDTGYGFGNLRKTVSSITAKPLYIVNTHGHADHVGANSQFDVPCHIHQDDIELCIAHTSFNTRKESVKMAKESVNSKTGDAYNALPEDFDEEEYCNSGTGALVTAKEGISFDLGGIQLKIIETPGHTRGGISVWYEEKGLMFTGDAVSHFLWLFGKESSSREVYLQMLNRLRELPVESFITGHHPTPIEKKALDRYIKVAAEADFRKGTPFITFASGDIDTRICTLNGMSLDYFLTRILQQLLLMKTNRKTRF